MSTKISGSKYAAMYGPTTGDKVRLADTSLVIEVEKDYTTYGDEVKFGGGKTIRDGMGQSVKTCSKDGDLDLVITNALIVDSTGIVKADIGIKDGKIAGIGKAGNPDIMDGVTPGMTVGASTEALAGEGMIVTAGGIDTHIHFISPQQIDCALYSGVTTMIGGGTGPADGTNATTCTPGPWNLKMMLKAAEEYPMNLGFLGKGNCSDEAPLIEQVKAGAMGLKIHEDWGATPAVINHCLNVADEYDVQVAIHTDTLNEGGCVEDTLAAIGGRTIHTYHTEGAGGGHAPDIIRAAAAPNVLPSSTNPTMPYTVNTLDEHLDMLMVCHHLDKRIPEDVAFADSRIRPETIAAEDVLHDMGIFSMMSSDSQAMGRVGEVITRTWQTASKMKDERGALPEDAGHDNDNFRVKRYISKYTINPAITHGISQYVGSVEEGKFADLVPSLVYNLSFFCFASIAAFICPSKKFSVISIWLICPSVSVFPNNFDNIFKTFLSSSFKLLFVSSTACSQATSAVVFSIFSSAFLNICPIFLFELLDISLKISGIGSYVNFILFFNMFNVFFISSNSCNLYTYLFDINFPIILENTKIKNNIKYLIICILIYLVLSIFSIIFI